MSLADFYAQEAVNVLEFETGGDDVILSPADPGEYRRIARAAQERLLKDFKDAVLLLDRATEFEDGGWASEARQFIAKIHSKSKYVLPSVSQVAEG